MHSTAARWLLHLATKYHSSNEGGERLMKTRLGFSLMVAFKPILKGRVSDTGSQRKKRTRFHTEMISLIQLTPQTALVEWPTLALNALLML